MTPADQRGLLVFVAPLLSRNACGAAVEVGSGLRRIALVGPAAGTSSAEVGGPHRRGGSLRDHRESSAEEW